MLFNKVFEKLKSNKLFKSMSIYFVSQMVNAFLPVIIIPIISHTLSLSDYGDYSLYKSIFAFLIPLVGLSFSNAVVRKYYTIDKNDFKTYMFTLMCIITLAGVLLYLIILFNINFLLSILKTNNPRIIFFSLYVAYFTSFSSILVGYYRVINDSKRYLITNIIIVVLTLGGVVLLNNNNLLSINNLLLIHLLAIGLSVVYNLIIFFEKEFTFRLDFSNIKDTIYYCSPLIVYAILAQIYASSDRFIINFYVDKENVALYSAGIQMAFVVPIIGQSIQLAWTPYVFEKLSKKEMPNKLSKITMVLVWLLIAFSVFYTFVYPFIFKLFLPESYNPVLEYYYFFIIAGLFQSLYWLYNPFLLFHEKNSFFIYITLIAATLSLVLNLLFVSKGLIWVALTFAISWFTQFIFLLIAIRYVENIKKNV